MLGRLQPAWLFRGLVDANPDITFHLFYVLQDGFVFSSFAANSYAASFARLENATAIIEALTRSRRRTRYTIIARKSRTIQSWRRFLGVERLSKTEYPERVEAHVLDMFEKQAACAFGAQFPRISARMREHRASLFHVSERFASAC